MGVNIHIDCDGWDACANAGMKIILYDNEKFPKVRFPTYDEFLDDFRPADFTLWRKSIADLGCNVEMWLHGLAALEANPDLKASCSA